MQSGIESGKARFEYGCSGKEFDSGYVSLAYNQGLETKGLGLLS